MSAQYRPYRDEESVDGIEATWSEPGTIQIYEKTTEDLPFGQNKRRFWLKVAAFITVGIVGFLIGTLFPVHTGKRITQDVSNDIAQDLPLYATAAKEDSNIKSKLLNSISGRSILDMLEKYQNVNRIPGSPTDHGFAIDIEKKFREIGFDSVTITNNSFKTMLPSKRTIIRLLDNNNNTIYTNLNEDYKYSGVRPFLPLSQANETIIHTDQLVYINHGTKEDYKKLLNLGFNDTEGKVVVIKQTHHKAHDIVITAQDLGAAAILIFPDPDLFINGKSPFPEGVRLPPDAERAHPLAWGDYGDLDMNTSNKLGIDLTKLGIEREAKIQIPVIPISYSTASWILQGLEGEQAPVEWNCFDYTLHIGPGYKDTGLDAGPHRASIQVEFHNQETDFESATVTAKIRGELEPDRYIVVGSRRDSVSRGTLDSLSGIALMIEIAEAFQNLIKIGWKPRRSILFNSFGAESLNLLGSSDWLESHQKMLYSRAIAYVNCDLVVTGNHTVAITASPLLYQVLYNATKQVPDPNEKHKTVYEAWKETHQTIKKQLHKTNKIVDHDTHQHGSAFSEFFEEYTGDTDEDSIGSSGSIVSFYKKSALIKTRPTVRKLDLAAMYSPFFLYAGTPIIDVKYVGFPNVHGHPNASLVEETLPVLGTRYDNLQLLKRIDPTMKYHVAVGQILSEVIRDLCDSPFIPFNLFDYGLTLEESYNNFAEEYNKLPLANGTHIDLESMRQAVQAFLVASIQFHEKQDKTNPKDLLSVRMLNDQLMALERTFLDPSGIPNQLGRRHMVLATNEGGQNNTASFPGLVDWLALLKGAELDEAEQIMFVEILKLYYKSVVYAISSGVQVLELA